MSIFILGSSGFVGNVLYRSMSNDFVVYTVGRKSSHYHIDLSDINSLHDFNMIGKGDYFLFLAAISSPEICAREPDLAWRVNVENTIALINQLVARGVRIIFASSDVVMGNRRGKSFDDSSLQPSGIYGEMKAAVENAVADNPFVKVMRFSYVLGKGDKFSAMLKESADSGKKVDIFAGFERNIVSIDDVITGINRLITHWDDYPEKVFNFSGPDLVSREKMTKALSTVIDGLDYTVTEAPDGFWDNRERVIETDCQNFSRLLGRKPKNLNQIIAGWGK